MTYFKVCHLERVMEAVDNLRIACNLAEVKLDIYLI
jgi:hypothetical protein